MRTQNNRKKEVKCPKCGGTKFNLIQTNNEHIVITDIDTSNFKNGGIFTEVGHSFVSTTYILTCLNCKHEMVLTINYLDNKSFKDLFSDDKANFEFTETIKFIIEKSKENVCSLNDIPKELEHLQKMFSKQNNFSISIFRTIDRDDVNKGIKDD